MIKDEALKLAMDWYDSGNEDRDAFQAMIESILMQPEPVAWMLNVDINNWQGQSEYRTVLAFRRDPVVTGNYEINEIINARPLIFKD